jgi:predicted nucleotidyltransferase
MEHTTTLVRETPISLPPLAEDDGLVSVDKIVAAVLRIVDLADPVQVIAFGSRVRGEHRPESDLDLAVIVDAYNPRLAFPPVNRTDIDVWMPIDLVVYDVVREQRMRQSVNSLQSVVAEEGIVLYERTTGIVDRGAAERLV